VSKAKYRSSASLLGEEGEEKIGGIVRTEGEWYFLWEGICVPIHFFEANAPPPPPPPEP
jgi:hypothetical protein